jgi:hypothetical protein
LCSCSCWFCPPGVEKIKVSWNPGYEYVPDCTPLYKVTGNTVDINGTVFTSATTKLGSGEIKVTPAALQQVSQAGLAADQKYVQLCRLFPSYADSKKSFYAARGQMTDLIQATNNLVMEASAQAGVPQPPQPTTIPTAAPAAAKAAGTDPTQAVAPIQAPASTPANSSTTPPPVNPVTTAKVSTIATNAAKKVKEAAKKKAPSTPAPAS